MRCVLKRDACSAVLALTVLTAGFSPKAIAQSVNIPLQLEQAADGVVLTIPGPSGAPPMAVCLTLNANDAASGAHDVSGSTCGFATGADYRATPNTTLGFAVAGGGTNWSLSDGLAAATARRRKSASMRGRKRAPPTSPARSPSPTIGSTPTAKPSTPIPSPVNSARRALARAPSSAIASTCQRALCRR